MGNKKLPDMPFKKKAMKLLEDLSLDELYEARNCIDDLITERECSGTKRQKESNKAEDKLPGLLRQERFYHIFTCKFKKVNELKKPAFSGIVVDISKSGLRLKAKKKITIGSILVVFPEKKEEASILAISPEYDHEGSKIFVEVIRVKEVLEMTEIGCKFLPRNSLLFNIVV